MLGTPGAIKVGDFWPSPQQPSVYDTERPSSKLCKQLPLKVHEF